MAHAAEARVLGVACSLGILRWGEGGAEGATGAVDDDSGVGRYFVDDFPDAGLGTCTDCTRRYEIHAA